MIEFLVRANSGSIAARSAARLLQNRGGRAAVLRERLRGREQQTPLAVVEIRLLQG